MTATVTRGAILAAVLHDATQVADVVGVEIHGHHVTVRVPTTQDLAAAAEHLFRASALGVGSAAGRWQLVDLNAQTRTEIGVTIRVVVP